MFGEGLLLLLEAKTGLTNLLGTSRSDRTSGIFPHLGPNDATMPYLTYMQVSGEPVISMVGMNRLTQVRYRFSCYGSSYGSAKNVAEQLRQVFTSFTGTLSDADHTKLEQAIQIMEADDAEPLPHGTIFSVHLDFEFWYVNQSPNT